MNYLPINPTQGESEGSEEEVDNEERSKFDLSSWLSHHPIKQNMVLSDSVKESRKGENDTKYTKPN